MIINKILVVDDSELLHRMYDLVFNPYVAKGSKVLHALNGMEAFSMLNEHPDTSLIILDVNMPVMSGLEFLARRKKKQVFQDIPVVIISTEGKQEDTIRGLQAGARAYLTKPFQPNELYTIIEQLCDGRTASAVAAGEREASASAGIEILNESRLYKKQFST